MLIAIDIDTHKLKHFSFQNNFTQHKKDHTRPKDSKSTVDIFFLDCKHVKAAGVLPWNVSDNVSSYINVKKTRHVPTKSEFKGY